MQNNLNPDITLKSRINYMEESRFEMNRELDSSKMTIEILRNENENFQKIMNEELHKRKCVIEELVR